ncbi:MAG: HAD-IA family hydrolase [Gammaproteobacteria bacterium]|nr:HAD-IA family hydrolase [Gammaproteobacteria bacterium]
MSLNSQPVSATADDTGAVALPPAPRIILFDWHATLVDTMEAMYQAMDDMLAMLDRIGLKDRLVGADKSKNEEDRKLVEYVRDHHHLHPKIVKDRKVSRTDLLEVLFGGDQEAKEIAHQAFNDCYQHHYGDVTPLEPDLREVLIALRRMGLKLGILSNRSREFLLHELDCIDHGTWFALFDVIVAGDDTARLKPAPDPLFRALEVLREPPGPDIWYIGDSTTDTTAAKLAGITSVFYNGAGWEKNWLAKIFPGTEDHPYRPDAVVNDFRGFLELVNTARRLDAAGSGSSSLAPFARRVVTLPHPSVILFDWHATLADTLDAMYQAVDEVLPKLEELGLADRLVDPEDSKNEHDQKLVVYVKENYKLHPKIKAARKISRTDIFEVLFGHDKEAKRIAHGVFNVCYRNHYGHVEPFEPDVRKILEIVKALHIRTGVLSNRDREFLEHELNNIEGTGWRHLFDTMVAGDDTERRKPEPDPILKALENLNLEADEHVWYVGDSTTDTVAAKQAGATSVFYNGAQWSNYWVAKIFPGTEQYPHQPDAIVDDFKGFIRLVKKSLVA